MQCAICGRPLTKLERPNHPLGYVGPVCIKKDSDGDILILLEAMGYEADLRPSVAYLRRIGIAADMTGDDMKRITITGKTDLDPSTLTKTERRHRDAVLAIAGVPA